MNDIVKQSTLSSWLCKQNHPSTATSNDNSLISIQANESKTFTLNTVKDDDSITSIHRLQQKREKFICHIKRYLIFWLLINIQLMKIKL